MVESLTNLAFAILFFTAAASLGAELFRISKLRFDSRPERLLYSSGLGLGIFSLVTLILGLLGGYHTTTAYIIFTTALLVGARRLWRGALTLYRYGLVEKIARVLRKLPKTTKALLGLAVLTAGLMITISLAPPLEWDTLQYHFSVPEIYIQNKRIVYTPTIINSHFPQFVEMLYLLSMLLRGDIAAQLVATFFGLLSLLATYQLARRLRADTNTAITSVIIMSALPVFFFVSTTAYIEPARIFYFTLAFSSFLKWWKGNRRKDLNLTALNLGFFCACKLVDLFGPAILGALTLAKGIAEKRPAQEIAKNLLTVGLLPALIAAPWYLKTLIFVGNPFFPYLYTLLGGKNWSLKHAAVWKGSGSILDWRRGLQNLLTVPLNMFFGPREARWR